MKKRILTISICLFIIVVITIVSTNSAKKPFKDLNSHEIESVSVLVEPPNETIQITEIKDFIEHLKNIKVYELELKYYAEYLENIKNSESSQHFAFTIIKRDRSVLKIISSNEVVSSNTLILIDGVGYRCKYKPIESLNNYASSLLSK